MSDTKPTVDELLAAFAVIDRAEKAIEAQAMAAGLDVRVSISIGGSGKAQIEFNSGPNLFYNGGPRRRHSYAFARYGDEARIAAVIEEGARPK